MTRVAISSIQNDQGQTYYDAIAGDRYTKGRTTGEALDALNKQLGDEAGTTLIILQNYRPDGFFDASQQKRLKELMALWRSAKDQGMPFLKKQQDELDYLVEQELLASAKRATALKHEITK